MAATKLHPATVARLHPLAEEKAEALSGGDRALWRIEDERCVLVVNYSDWRPGRRNRKPRKAR